ncbi:MAG TPA: hypothetical protein VFD31_02760 [Thermoleophilaceae bacterium]|nr:hypothetical protein [Thermoleophilaceae bacterium]
MTVNGEVRSKTYYPNDPGAGGEVVNHRLRMVFRDVRVVVARFPGVPVSLGIPGNSARGSVSTSHSYKDDKRFTPEDNRPVCDVGFHYPNMAATLSLSGSAAGRGLPGRFALYADHAQQDILSDLSEEAANFACPERQPGSPLGYGIDLGPILLRGATLNGHAANFLLVRDWSRPALRSPLAALIRGRGFRFDTGLRTQTLVNNQPSTVATCPDPGEGCTVDEVGKRLKISLRRRR